MKITGISLQARDKNRVNVSIDGKYRFSLDVLQVGELGLKVGRGYTEEELQQLEDESQFGKLYTRALEYCLLRPRAVREMRDYLWRKTRPTKRRSPKTGEIIERPGVSSAITERVLERLITKGYLDDVKFARFWFEHRFVQKGTSVRRLKLELAQKGISKEVIDELVAAEIRSDKDELAKIIAKKWRKYPDRQKFMAYLARQGFSYDDIVTALERRSE
ncbi:MAG: regulatory protein RecX [Candidatus Saccharibacteria bacterium]|nr:regulatory protein RecX [Candidatus Saccharibacteria bacterium]